MNILYEIKDMMEDELKKICKANEITGSDLEEIDKMVDIIKDIDTIEAMKSVELNGYSGNYSYADANMRGYSEVWPYNMPVYARDARGGEYSMARGRDSMGRYTSRDSNYSRHDAKDEIVEKLNDLMMNAHNEEEREKYRRAIEQLNR